MAELQPHSKRVRAPVKLLRSLSDYHTWKRYETPYELKMALLLNNPRSLIFQETKLENLEQIHL